MLEEDFLKLPLKIACKSDEIELIKKYIFAFKTGDNKYVYEWKKYLDCFEGFVNDIITEEFIQKDYNEYGIEFIYLPSVEKIDIELCLRIVHKLYEWKINNNIPLNKIIQENSNDEKEFYYYIKDYIKQFSNEELKRLHEIILYLNFESILNICCFHILDIMKGKTVADLREIMLINNENTLTNEDKIRLRQYLDYELPDF